MFKLEILKFLHLFQLTEIGHLFHSNATNHSHKEYKLWNKIALKWAIIVFPKNLNHICALKNPVISEKLPAFFCCFGAISICSLSLLCIVYVYVV